MESIKNILKLANISKQFEEVVAVDNVSLEINEGEFITLLGPSGSGKTTILLMIAGFQTPTMGEIFIKGEQMTPVPPQKRNIGIVFQSYALFPHLTVFENIAYPLQMRKYNGSEIKVKVEAMLELVKLVGLGKRYPKQLSGGQQQRVALSRALVFNPDLLLMDEPLGALDKKMREHMQIELKNLQDKLKITVIYVTHDQEEGLVMSDRIAVLNRGRIEQIGSPYDLYEYPSNAFIADFIGETNFISGTIIRQEAGHFVATTHGGLTFLVPYSDHLKKGETITLSIRPEKITLSEEEKGDHVYEGNIEDVIYIGETTKYVINLSGKEVLNVKEQNRPHSRKFKKGDRVRISWDFSDSRLLA
jgi:spermidine/putrescine ABC transporter ATP-binding subunit